ncbi:hypothetical protein M9H77_24725 [Catharanthus roseus]|uniref:Uncharacterized protein n=1 Tax=Catharanthus roseus TaxID=4058 RepID=A0ACC0A4T9_CATRO|nr:hypothetical protein M9H77_24725 [Catharanthus roseus]
MNGFRATACVSLWGIIKTPKKPATFPGTESIKTQSEIKCKDTSQEQRISKAAVYPHSFSSLNRQQGLARTVVIDILPGFMPFSLLHTKVDQSHLKIVAQQEHLRNAQITMDVKLTLATKQTASSEFLLIHAKEERRKSHSIYVYQALPQNNSSSEAESSEVLQSASFICLINPPNRT